MKYWEIIADNLKKAGWSSGCVSAVDSGWTDDLDCSAHRSERKRFVVRADEKLTAFMELESAIYAISPLEEVPLGVTGISIAPENGARYVEMFLDQYHAEEQLV